MVFNQAIAGVVREYVKKGTRVAFEGMIKTRKWQDKDGKDRWSTEIVIGRFDGRLGLEGQPQGAKRDEHAYGITQTRATASPPAAPAAGYKRDLDDEIPF